MFPFKKWIKRIANQLPFAITANQRYDRLTKAIIQQTCKADSICVDIGSHEGTILKMFIEQCPKAVHYAFEPIPSLYKLLKRKYTSACQVFPYALSNTTAKTSFQFAPTHPAFSGLLERKLPKDITTTTIEVETACLDNIIPNNTIIRLIKLDIEGGEYNALLGAEQTILRSHPIILFEFGKGAADVYQVNPIQMFQLFGKWNYSIFLLPHFLENKPPLTFYQFEMTYQNNSDYFFMAVHQ